MPANQRLTSLYSAITEGTLTPLMLSKEERCDLFCHALGDRQTDISQKLLVNGFSQSNESEPNLDAVAADTAKDEIIEILIERFSQTNDLPASLFMDLAISEGNAELVSLLLNKGVDVHAKVSGPFTAIQLAVMQGHSTVVEVLLAANANVNSKHKGSTLLHAAVCRGDEATTSTLLKHGAVVNTKRRDGTTALYTAVERGFSQIAARLIDAGADFEAKFTSNTLDPLKELIMSHRDFILTSRGLSPQHITADYHSRCVRNRSLLHIAAENGYSEIVKLLLDRGADVSACDNFGRTSLYLAAFNGHEDVVKLLCDHGADINLTDTDYQTLLHYFAVGGCLESAELVLKFGANINAENVCGRTPLFSAVESSQLALVKLLMKNGAKTRDSNESTPLHVAADCGSVEVVQYLLSCGVDTDSINRSGETALHLAVWKGRETVARLLLEKGANVNAATSQRENGRTALLIAVNEGDLKTVETVLKFGADVDFKDSGFHESSALRIATEKGFYQIVELLLDYGANPELRDRGGATAFLLAVDRIPLNPELPSKTTYHGILRDHLGVIKTLLKFSADVNARDKEGMTPLKLAVRQEKFSALKIILEYGSADVRTLSETDVNRLLDEVNIARSTKIKKLVAQNLIRHVVKMKVAKLYVENETLGVEKFNDLGEIGAFRKTCAKEVVEMKVERIGDSVYSYYDILTAEIYELAVVLGDLTTSETIARTLDAGDFMERFPIYGSMVNNQLEKGLIRKKLLDQGIKICHRIFNRIYALPDDITERIAVMFLDSKDLRTLITAVRGNRVLDEKYSKY